MEFKKRTRLPIIACVMDVGAGGAYYASTAADQIVAHPTSVVGGLGVLLNLYNLEDALGMLSIVGTPVRSGENTDLGSPLRMMSGESREILQGIADEFHDRLILNIQESRAQVDDIDSVVFDGRVFTAYEALDHGLVDQIGYLDDAIEACRSAAESPRAAVVILHRPRDTAHTAYDVTPNQPIRTGLLPHVAGLNRSMLPTFLYIWQPDPALETSLGN
jgi:protease-4